MEVQGGQEKHWGRYPTLDGLTPETSVVTAIVHGLQDVQRQVTYSPCPHELTVQRKRKNCKIGTINNKRYRKTAWEKAASQSTWLRGWESGGSWVGGQRTSIQAEIQTSITLRLPPIKDKIKRKSLSTGPHLLWNRSAVIGKRVMSRLLPENL